MPTTRRHCRPNDCCSVGKPVGGSRNSGTNPALGDRAVPGPAELLGRWRTTLAPGDDPILTIRKTGYVIQRFDTGTGRIEVHGDEIDFLASNLCNGVGRYRWTLEGNELTFVPIGPDECPGRAEALKDKTYTRLG